MELKILKILNQLALKAIKRSEVPVSAVLVYENKIIAKAYNKRNKTNSTISHAEIKVIQKANKKLKSWRLNNCTIYVTIEPCDMCKSVIKEARINKVYYLLDRKTNKKQYDKTKFLKLELESEKDTNEYLNNLNNFWKNLRKKN